MTKGRTDMALLRLLSATAALACFFGVTNAGPLPTNSSIEVGQSGSCALGDVVYLPGDEFPGASPCERCHCGAGGVSCSQQTCQPRPGCKAVHRPDACCPTYQCDCEQEGRVYGNGEKLVDPQDPCRVCYCQGGEVVCRRIACFQRDDCRPRLVPGRCCPEYDNCPLRGVTNAPGATSSDSGLTSYEKVSVSSAEPALSEKPKAEITIKEITPVSEIPATSGVKIKEILPSPSIEVIEYPASSKSPLIPREATTEKSLGEEIDGPEYDATLEKLSSPSSVSLSASSSQEFSTNSSPELTESKTTAESVPSKISLSTQGFVSSEIPSSLSLISIEITSTTKAPAIEEEDTSLFDVNPAFPPLPDDLSVLSNHGDELIPESHIDHVHGGHEVFVSSEAPARENPTATVSPSIMTSATRNETPFDVTTQKNLETTTKKQLYRQDEVSTETIPLKNSSMFNLRAAIPTELLNEPLSKSDVINGELDDVDVSTTVESIHLIDLKEQTTLVYQSPSSIQNKSTMTTSIDTTSSSLESSTVNKDRYQTRTDSSIMTEELTTTGLSKLNIATENNEQTELSSLPIETSNQKPPITPESEVKTSSTSELLTSPTTDKVLPTETKLTTAERTLTSTLRVNPNDYAETTENIVNFFSSVETSTDSVEIITSNTSNESRKNAAVVSSVHNRNSLTDLINLVGDVASISDRTEMPATMKIGSSSISSSEELLLVPSIGYKSKNNNWNVNSITEVPLKPKSTTNKGKIVEIDDDEATITDLPAHDKNEPTTQRPIIDNVIAGNSKNRTDSKDIEIISNSYVPSISRRPTKVVMKKNSGQAVSDMVQTEMSLVSNVMTTMGMASNGEAETSTEPTSRVPGKSEEAVSTPAPQ